MKYDQNVLYIDLKFKNPLPKDMITKRSNHFALKANYSSYSHFESVAQDITSDVYRSCATNMACKFSNELEYSGHLAQIHAGILILTGMGKENHCFQM